MAARHVRTLVLACLMASGAAQAEGFALGIKAGTLGVGPEVTYAFSERFSVRLGVNNITYGFTTTTSGVRYDADLDLVNTTLLLDWHPFRGLFHVTTGFIRNGNVLRLTATPTQAEEIGGITFQPEQIGTLVGEASFDRNAPYLGIGWGNGAQEPGLEVHLELGAMFQGSAGVSLRSRGGEFAGNPVLEEALRREERELEEDLRDFRLYPVISFGLSYSF